MRDYYYITGKEINWNILNECFRFNQHCIIAVFIVIRQCAQLLKKPQTDLKIQSLQSLCEDSVRIELYGKVARFSVTLCVEGNI